MADQETDDPTPSSMSPALMLLPMAVAVGALAVGLVVGGGFAWLLKPAEQVEVPVMREPTAEELIGLCKPQVEEKVGELVEAQTRVSSLEADVKAKEARVAELEADMSKRAERGAAVSRELEQARAELASLRSELATALTQKAQIEQELQVTVAKLQDTEVKLEEQKQLTDRAKEDALVNKYERFKNDAQLEICEKGGRKKMTNCRESVLAHLSNPQIRDKFSHCVRSGQAVPTVIEMTAKSGQLPDYSQWIDQDDKVTKDWYLQFCDPTLPESDGFLNEEHLPGTADELPEAP